MSKSDFQSVLSVYPVLADLPQPLLKEIQRTAVRIQAPAGKALFQEGDPCTHFPLLVDGVIRATKRGVDGHEILLYRLHPGEICVITVVSLLGGTPYPAMAVADTELTLFGVPRALFLDLVLTSPPFRTVVFQFLSIRMAHLMALIDDVVFRRLDQRLAAQLLVHNGPIRVTHQMLADELGTTREVVSRTLEGLKERGLVRLGRKHIEVVDRSALRRLRGADA